MKWRGSCLLARRRSAPVVVAAPDMLPFGDASRDLVVSALGLQFVDDLPGVFVQVRRALKPDGLFLAALAGGDTLTELRQALDAAYPDTHKELSIAIGSHVKEDNRLLGDLDNSFDSAGSLLSGTMKRLGSLADSGGNRHMLYLALFVIFVLLLVYKLFR